MQEIEIPDVVVHMKDIPGFSQLLYAAEQRVFRLRRHLVRNMSMKDANRGVLRDAFRDDRQMGYAECPLHRKRMQATT
jgi:hypothetical protein